MDQAIEIRTADILLIIVFGTIALTATSLLVIFIMMRLKKNRETHSKEIDSLTFTFEQELLQTQLEIQEQTLKTISEEIHDNVGQVLSLAKLNLNTFEVSPEKKLQDTKQLISKAINDLRNLSRSMHGDRIAELGLLQSLADELQILENSGEFKTGMKITGSQYKLAPQKEMVLFRIVQEALNNAIKHAKAKNINLLLDYKPGLFTLTVSDDGNGFDSTQVKNGIGLKSMHNRALLIGGNCNLQSSTDSGTSITIELPNP